MRTVQVTMYLINELPEKEKQKAIDKHRDINVNYDWYDGTIEGFEEELKEKGIEISKSNKHKNCAFELHCQGSHASFGTDIIDNKKFIEGYGLQKDFPLIYRYHNMFNIFINLTGRNDNCMTEDHEDLIDFDTDRDEAFQLMEVLAQTTWEVETEKYAETVESICKEEAGKLLKRLYDDYEYLTSDEAIIETMLANEMEFEL